MSCHLGPASVDTVKIALTNSPILVTQFMYAPVWLPQFFVH